MPQAAILGIVTSQSQSDIWAAENFDSLR